MIVLRRAYLQTIMFDMDSWSIPCDACHAIDARAPSKEACTHSFHDSCLLQAGCMVVDIRMDCYPDFAVFRVQAGDDGPAAIMQVSSQREPKQLEPLLGI